MEMCHIIIQSEFEYSVKASNIPPIPISRWNYVKWIQICYSRVHIRVVAIHKLYW